MLFGALVLLVAVAFSATGLSFYWWRQNRRLHARLDTGLMELQRLQIEFGRFAPQEIVNRIVASGLPAHGERKEVTVLFADIVGFTTLSETLAPELLVQLLNGYFNRVGRAVGEHRGHVAKFIGDGVLALFGAIAPNPWQCNDAAHAALAILEAVHGYNLELAERGLPALRVGIGLHCGGTVAGVIGSRELMEFTAIGTTVNLASRIERLTRPLAEKILLSAAVRERLDPRFRLREMQPMEVKGVSEPVVTFALDGFAEVMGHE